ncbi:hypothetical protein STCU_02650 [Strigomonas culicis]|uniref:Prefoldin alpha subunit n=1 Tax=Strigomonas culicis TaxID=28005 RepID=S9UPG6_9TRYP|nr:hypothetical protein STCU_02650 [Strigomonas culicis]|eukprot:EPY32787.1 hypothetical protein STCU_02650 [Strigomonas culicis]
MQEQLTNDVRNLGAAYDALNGVRARFMDNHNAVDQFGRVGKEKVAQEQSAAADGADDDMLVCMTSSLLLRGSLIPAETVLIDVGTGYFIERSIESAKEYFTLRAAKMKEAMDDTEKTLKKKQDELEQVSYVLRVRMAEVEAMQQQE